MIFFLFQNSALTAIVLRELCKLEHKKALSFLFTLPRKVSFKQFAQHYVKVFWQKALCPPPLYAKLFFFAGVLIPLLALTVIKLNVVEFSRILFEEILTLSSSWSDDWSLSDVIQIPWEQRNGSIDPIDTQQILRLWSILNAPETEVFLKALI